MLKLLAFCTDDYIEKMIAYFDLLDFSIYRLLKTRHKSVVSIYNEYEVKKKKWYFVM